MEVYAVKQENYYFNYIDEMWVEQLDAGCVFKSLSAASSFAYNAGNAAVVTYELKESKTTPIV